MKTKGFTLVELLVVIAILAILAAVSVVGYTSFINDSKNSVAMQELTQVRDYVVAKSYLETVTVDATLLGELGLTGGKIETTVPDDASTTNKNEAVYTYTSEGGTAHWVVDTNTVVAGAYSAN